MTSELETSTVVEESAIARNLTEEYFRSFNENQFEQTAALFSEEGALVPPFDPPAIGHQAILDYLEKEASKITAFPEQWETQAAEADTWHTTVAGKVNAIVFKVNIAWYFTIRSTDNEAGAEIERVRIKLLASPAELLGLRTAS